MSAAKKCDRCGAYFQPKGLRGQYAFIINPEHGREGKGFDLCDECMKKLAVWLKDEVEQ